MVTGRKALRQKTSSNISHNGNRLLAALAPQEFERIRPGLTRVEMKQKHVLWEPNQPIGKVHFPIDAIASVLAETDAGPVEIGTIGNEGLVGLPVFLGAQSFAGRAIIQMSGEADEMDADAFREVVRQAGAFRELLQRYTWGFMTQVAQGTACNRAHSTAQRLARWLLIMRDRVGRNEFPLTHEFMGQMLGVRRATVSETAAALQETGLISYRRGVITIEDGPALERAACECYWIVRGEFDRLIGVARG